MAAEIRPDVMPVPGDRLDLAVEEAVDLLSREKTGGTRLVIADSVERVANGNDASEHDTANSPIQFLALSGQGTPEAESVRAAARAWDASLQFATPVDEDVTRYTAFHVLYCHAIPYRGCWKSAGSVSVWW